MLIDDLATQLGEDGPLRPQLIQLINEAILNWHFTEQDMEEPPDDLTAYTIEEITGIEIEDIVIYNGPTPAIVGVVPFTRLTTRLAVHKMPNINANYEWNVASRSDYTAINPWFDFDLESAKFVESTS